jgi:hypothetical protein
MHEVRILFGDTGTYIVPVELVEDFLACDELVQELVPTSEEWYNACEGFESRFRQFNIEGRLSSIPFFVEEGSY